MGIRVALNHRTSYRYGRAITVGPQSVRLRPAPHCRGSVLSYSFRAEPRGHFVNWQQDPWGNHVARLVFPDPVDRLELEVDLLVDLTVINPFDFFLEPVGEEYPFEYPADLRRHLAPYLETRDCGPLFERYLESVDRSRVRSVDFIVEQNRLLHESLNYLIRMEPGLQTPEQTLELGQGACRDFAWLQVHVFRRLGLAARFVSGYSIQLIADQKPLDGPGGVDRDVVDLHAWTEVYLPGAGWIGLDATSGMLAGEGHIPLACTPDPAAAAPISGAIEQCESEFAVEMRVSRIREAPRTTKPYTDTQWAAILACGEAVDERLAEQDVRLTMGGEPTFVSTDDFVSDEWTVAAVGPQKRRRAEALMRRLHRRFAPGGLLHNGAGKWYPGESLPRWALNCYWRVDGEPLWDDVGLLADPTESGSSNVDDARRFMHALANRLGVEAQHAVPAYEDPAYFMWREGRLPVNVDPVDSRLDDPEERARLARVFEHGLDRPVGWVLPLERAKGSEMIWHSGLWMLRSKHLLLEPGDSSIGLRLPLPALPWVPAGDLPPRHPPDPSVPRPPLTPRLSPLPVPALAASVAEVRTQSRSKTSVGRPKAVQPAERTSGQPIRTALCVEPRDGHLHVFLPPLEDADDWVRLVGAVEATAADLRLPVALEGYEPPVDPRLRCITVTPDPGVIEVNVHPAAGWRELTEITLGVYEEAHQVRLGPEKFLVDGRRVGTGGGNHIVMGAAEPLDSAFLRRPALLRSFVAYWNNHPSLSYLFSSLFIGPTSQHPRIDEARHDQLYELEIAMELADDAGECPPWLVDRLFRDLLVDSSGNTHRAEFCIDKLYSPDSATGRLGLVELRAFEMPPHARMSVAQQLLLRSLVSRFWDAPYRDRLVRWGTDLHDRFMLPAWIWRDFQDVLDDLARAGYALSAEWFVPQYEFRFPRIGSIEHAGIEVELRHALEPWHVLGEEGVPGGTARYVDSSLERIEVRVSGMTEERYVVTCNQRRLPLRSTGTRGEYACGVRFRAWQPARCLHPTIPVHTPLAIDVVDTWAGRSIGGCTYHTVHPGGRNYDEPPVNAYEAESRRRVRFESIGHTPGDMTLNDETPHPEMPSTLDLRRDRRVGRSAG